MDLAIGFVLYLAGICTGVGGCGMWAMRAMGYRCTRNTKKGQRWEQVDDPKGDNVYPLYQYKENGRSNS